MILDIKKRKSLINFLFLAVSLFLAVDHFSNSEKDENINHSREKSINYSIEAMNDGFPLYTSNHFIYRDTEKHLPEYKVLNWLERPFYEPIETTWEDSGNFYLVYYSFHLKQLVSALPLEFSDLFYFQLAALIFICLFVFLVCQLTSPFYNFVFCLQLGIFLSTGNFEYNMLGYFTYPLVAFFQFFSLLFFVHYWRSDRHLIKRDMIIILFICILFASFIKSIRGDAGMFAFATIIVMASLFLWQSLLAKAMNRRFTIQLILVACVSWSLLAIAESGARFDRQLVHPIDVGKTTKYVSGHPIWMSLFTGFGYVDKEYGDGGGDDANAFRTLIDRWGVVEPQSKEFESKMKILLFEKISADPKLLWRAFALKTQALISVRHPAWGPTDIWYFPVGAYVVYLQALLCLGLSIYFCSFRERKYYIGFITLVILSAAPSFIREPYWPYATLFYSLIGLQLVLFPILLLKTGLARLIQILKLEVPTIDIIKY